LNELAYCPGIDNEQDECHGLFSLYGIQMEIETRADLAKWIDQAALTSTLDGEARVP